MDLSRRDFLALGGLALVGSSVNAAVARPQVPKPGATVTSRALAPSMFAQHLQAAYLAKTP